MKKHPLILSLLGFALCGFTAPIAAEDCEKCDECPKPICKPICQPNVCCEQSFCDGKITAGAEWLYWKVEQDGLNFGNIVNFTSPNLFTTSSVAVRPNFKYDSGFRVHLGYELPCDCWDVDVSYTYLPSHAKTTTFASGSVTRGFQVNVVDFPILSTSNFYGSSEGFAAKWNLTANNIDVDIGRSVCFGECLRIRPHIGFRTLWFDQKLRMASQNILAGSASELSEVLIKEKFTGYGIEGGLWGEWQIGCGFSFVGHFGGSILYSKYSVQQSLVSTLNNGFEAPIPLADASVCDTIHAGTPTLDTFLGLQYDSCMCDMPVSAHVGWEQHVVFDANRLARAGGNLSAQGLTVGLEVGF